MSLRIDWTITLGPRQRRRDIDNVIAALKSYQDGIFDALGWNDKLVTEVGVTWERGESSWTTCRVTPLKMIE